MEKWYYYEYDGLGRLTAVVQTLNQSVTDPVNLRTEYGYDEAGRLIKIEDANDNRTQFEYDKNGRRVAVELPLTQRSITTYDEVGNVQTVTDFNGDTITYSYDAENRLTSKHFSVSGESPVTFTYTPSGQIKTVVDARGTIAFNYDERGRLVSRIDPDGPYLASGVTIEYEYDENGNRTEVRTPNGVTQYEYDEQNRLQKVTDTDNAVTIYSYDAVGNLERTEFSNGVVETRTYDELNRLKLLEYQKDGVTLQSFDYSLDPVGHRRVVTELNGRRVEYEYDDLYRLTSETIFSANGVVERTISYGYDAVGNRLTKVDSINGVTIYTYDDNDRLLKEELRQNGVLVGSVEYGYDDNGNTETKTKKNAAGAIEETLIYSWNQDNRLIGLQNSKGDVISYEYDADGVRVSQTVNGVTTEYLVDKNRDYAQVLEEWVNDTLIASYVYGLDLISQERGNADSYYLVDGLGSTRGLTDAGGVVTDTYNYDAFGNLIGVFGRTENDYLFAGEQFDEDLGQYYLRERYYDAVTGRFSRRDTFEGYKTKPISLHDYVYADANPLSFIDPSGLVSINEFIVSNNIQNVLMTSFRIGNSFLNVLDKVNTTVSFIQDIQTFFNLASNPSSLYPALNTINFTGLPDLNEAIISLQANAPRIMSSILTNKIPLELAAFKKFFASNQSAYAFYPPDIFPKGISIPTGLKIKGRNVMIVTNNKADRLFGMGMLLKPGKDISLQFFRMDYGAFNHTPGGDSKNHDVWQDGNFHYHVPKN